MSIPVIDLFSGPGGLGEGFASLNDGRAFRIIVSAEMDAAAHKTLRLRSYFRKLRKWNLGMKAYYDFCNGLGDKEWNSPDTLAAWEAAGREALQLTLGKPEDNAMLDGILDQELKPGIECVLIGGPPCQAYSLVGRSRNLGKADYRPEDDHRHFLYREYLRVIQRCRPAVFVMENVKGILSSKVGGRRIFHDILHDLVDPDAALNGTRGNASTCYRIHSLVVPTTFHRGMSADEVNPGDFVIRAEDYGIPQARHRVILLGVREDITATPKLLPPSLKGPSVAEAIGDLPKLRSRLSKMTDSSVAWARIVRNHLLSLAKDSRKKKRDQLSDALARAASNINPDLEPGSLSEILCVRHNMSSRSMYAKQDEQEEIGGGTAEHPERSD